MPDLNLSNLFGSFRSQSPALSTHQPKVVAMPAPDAATYNKSRPVLGHVNLMADTLIANATTDEHVQFHTPGLGGLLTLHYSLRAIIRSMLATSPPAVAASFTSAARFRLNQSRSKSRSEPATLFATRPDSRNTVPTAELQSLLAYVRSLYGAGMGFDSVNVLSKVVRATSGLRWEDDGEMVEVLADIDADISQAIQSCKEELAAGNVRDLSWARASLKDIRLALEDCQREVEGWHGDFPFERGAANAQCMQI